MDTRTELSLFTGAGGGIYGSKLLGWRTVCYVERDKYCQRVIRQRIADGIFDDAPLWDDVRTFDGRPWNGLVDVVTGGFPCQPFSIAGKRQGAGDDRNLWPDTIRIIREVQPEWCLLENVPGLVTGRYFGTILGDLADSGFAVVWRVLSAAEVGAPHKRDRLWIIGRQFQVGHTNGARLAQREGKPQNAQPEQSPIVRADWSAGGWWESERGLGRVANGVANRRERLTAIGNGQVPLVAAVAWHHLSRYFE